MIFCAIFLLSCNIKTQYNPQILNDTVIVTQDVESFIKKEEGFRNKVYVCLGGVNTIGYGTRAKNVDEVIDEEEATKRMRSYLENVTYQKIKKLNVKYNSNQLIAISSFDFNTNKLDKIINSDGTINCEKIKLYNKIKVKNEDGSYSYVTNKVLNERRVREYDLCIK